MPILANLVPSSSADQSELVEVTEVTSGVAIESDVGLGDIVTTYNIISEPMATPLTSLTTLTTTSVLESVLSEPIMSVAATETADTETATDIGVESVLQS